MTTKHTRRTLQLLLSLLASLHSLAAQPAACMEPFPLHKIAGNLYCVGSKDLATYLIATPEGHILINSNFEESLPLIPASIDKLDFQFTELAK